MWYVRRHESVKGYDQIIDIDFYVFIEKIPTKIQKELLNKIQMLSI